MSLPRLNYVTLGHKGVFSFRVYDKPILTQDVMEKAVREFAEPLKLSQIQFWLVCTTQPWNE